MANSEVKLTDFYNPTGDITVMALCMIMAVFLLQGYTHKKKEMFSVIALLALECVSSVTNLIYNLNMYSEQINLVVVYGFRIVHSLVQAVTMIIYIRYLHEPLWIPYNSTKKFSIVSAVIIATTAVVDTFGTILNYGFYIDNAGIIHKNLNIFVFLHFGFMANIFYMIIKYRSRIIRQVFYCLIGVHIISVIVLMVQGLHHNSAFTSIAHFFPILGIIFLFHSNPYNVETGAVSGAYLSGELDELIEKKKDILIMTCKMMDFSKAIKLSKELKLEFYKFFRQNASRGVLYHFDDERFFLVIAKKKGIDYETMTKEMLDSFHNSYQIFRIDFKIAVANSINGINSGDEYINLMKFVEDRMPYNTVYNVGQKDVDEFFANNYIISQLEDIDLQKDLEDPRVLVYCQPVLNISKGGYDTAEALMRLQLEKTGMVFPDKFIPLAEQYNHIYMLSKIILNKTCQAVRKMITFGFEVSRISVNFSTLDIRHEHFCDDIKNIIEKNDIPYDKIAIEITESRSEADFNLLKEKVKQLQKLGIKFYLDDFGTGYSNFERIMEIPFDIIKFDKSLLAESVKNENSHFMVSTFSGMFDKLNYAVLFEGVENDNDEEWCKNMNARYLQGYKYSRPIPIAKLYDFFDKKAQ